MSPHNPQGSVSVSHDATTNALKVSVRMPEIAFMVSQEQFAHQPAHAITNVAKQMARIVEKHVAEHFAKAVQDQLSPQFNPSQFPKIHTTQNEVADKGSWPTWNEIQNQKYHEELAAMVAMPWSSPNHDVLKDISNWEAMDFANKHVIGIETMAPTYGPISSSTVKPKMSAGNAVVDLFIKLIPGFNDMTAACPVDDCNHKDALLKYAIIHLNDDHKWTREEIADWLDTLDHDLRIKEPEEVNEDGN